MFSDNPFFTIFNLKTIFIFFINWCIYATLCFYSQKKKEKKEESFQK